jgi:hypothetical protein
VLRRGNDALVETHLCDHNCTITYRGKATGGHYNCPAAFTLNRGAIASTTAPAELLLEGIDRVLRAASDAQLAFARDGFGAYADRFAIPDSLREPLRSTLIQEPREVALFGGSPEAHPDIVPILAGLQQRGYVTHITMTGRRAMRAAGCLDSLTSAGVSVIALSIDEVSSAPDLERLLQLTLAELRSEWRKISPLNGQRQKLVEAVHAARLWQQMPASGRPGLLFNMAVHGGNVAAMGRLLTALSTEFPRAMLNPFPMQSAFEGRRPDFTRDQLEDFREFTGRAIQEQHERAAGAAGSWGLVPRMHYWLLLSAALNAHDASSRLGGWTTWQCYRSAASGHYVQVAATGTRMLAPQPAGGRVGCFWNNALNDDSLPSIWHAPQDSIRKYLDERPQLATTGGAKCPGCLFPRLVGDMISLESGMDPGLCDSYLRLRKQHLAF